MAGDDRVRRCGECELKVFNTAAMSTAEITELISRHQGRLCIRLYRRADGTLLTKDCPTGLRAYRKRMGRIAASAAAAVLGLFSVSYGQRQTCEGAIDASKTVKIKRADKQTAGSTVKGTLLDPNGAVVPGREILLFKVGEKAVVKTVSTSEGEFVFNALSEGIYRIELPAGAGFNGLIVENIRVEKDRAAELRLSLSLTTNGEVVGIFLEEPMIDLTTTGPTPTRITREMIDRMPGGRP